MNFAKKLAGIAIMMLVAGCSGNQLDKSKVITEDSQKAVVVLALTSDGTGLSSPVLGWSAFDTETNLMIDKRVRVNKRTDSNAGDVLATMFVGQRDFGGKNYYVFEVDPGGYFLEYVHTSGNSGLFKRKVTTVYKEQSPAFVTQAGHVYYIGDFQFTAVGYQNTLRPVAPDPEGAEAIVRADYPNVKAPVDYQPARFISLNCRAQRTNIFGKELDFCAPGETDVVYSE